MDKCKCVLCGKEWEWFEWETGGKVVEPGTSMYGTSGIDVCMECRPIVYEFHRRIEDNRRELNRMMGEWYKVKKYGGIRHG
jgi:hypothetical protein